MVPPNIAALRQAAPVIVLREGASDPFEILLVRRNDVAFPNLSDHEEAADRMAAVRELEEEANVYVAVCIPSLREAL